jgi:DNA polymerase III alpha subunit
VAARPTARSAIASPSRRSIRSAIISSSSASSARGRKGWPDIDLDLPSGDRREAVIQEVYRRYGKHGAAMTANVITLSRASSAAREIGKALNLPPNILDRFSHLFASGDFPHTLELERANRARPDCRRESSAHVGVS